MSKISLSMSKTAKISHHGGKSEAKQGSVVGKKMPQTATDRGKTKSSIDVELANVSTAAVSSHVSNNGIASSKVMKKPTAASSNSDGNTGEPGKSRFGFGFSGTKQPAVPRDHKLSSEYSKITANATAKGTHSDEKSANFENYCVVSSFSTAEDTQIVNSNEKPAIYGAVEGPLVFSKANSISPECEDVFVAELPVRKSRPPLTRSQSGPEGDCSVPSESPIVSPVRHTSVSIGVDDQPVVVDAATYRNLTYELMVMKTMLLKLKRSMQEGGSQTQSVSSQPCTPQQEDRLLIEEDRPTVAERPQSFLSHFAGRANATESRLVRSPLSSPSRALDLAVQENQVLKQQVASLQQSLSDCNITVEHLRIQAASKQAGIVKSCVHVAVQTEHLSTVATVTGGHHGDSDAAPASQPQAMGGSSAATSQANVGQGQPAGVVGRGATRVSRIARKAVQSAVYTAH